MRAINAIQKAKKMILPIYTEPITKSFKEKYDAKVEFLQEKILYAESGQNNFNVINLEAGLGKSRETDMILAEEIIKWNGIKDETKLKDRRKFLLVKKFKNEVIQSELTIGRNDIFKNKVIGIHADNWSKGDHLNWNRDDLKEFQVIIITHSRYVKLCSDKKLRDIFTEGRHTLIIDEKIEFPTYSISKNDLSILRSAYNHTIHDLVDKVCKPLFVLIDDLKNRKNKNGKLIYNTQIMRCRPLLEDMNLISELQQHLKISNMPKEQKDIASNILNSMNMLYQNKCLFNRDKFTSTDPEHILFGLKNNIILDANGEIDALYNSVISENYIISRQSKIINHSNCIIQWINYNTSKNRILKTEEEYFGKIVSMIKEKHKQGDKTLIVLHKSFVFKEEREGVFINYLRKQSLNDIFIGVEDKEKKKEYQGQEIAVNWFGNIIGRNLWKDFNKCWVIGTPNLPMDTHILNLYQYSKKNDWKIGLGMVRVDTGKYQFENKSLEKIRKGYIIGELYQAIKRIQRNEKPQAEFYIVNHDEKVFNEVAKQVLDVKVLEPINLEIYTENEKQKKEKLESNRKEKTEAIIKIILDKKPSTYRKSAIAEEAEISVSHLSRYFNKEIPEVKKHIDKGDFVIKQQVIIRK
jgi:hypothetical protein